MTLWERRGDVMVAEDGRERPVEDFEPTWIAASVLRFSDGGDPSVEILHEGTREECERVADLIPAVSYSGERPVEGAEIVVREIPLDAATAEE